MSTGNRLVEFELGTTKAIPVETQPVSPKTDLWERFIKLRDFRNDVLHGNVKREENIYSFHEDRFLFYYGPAIDFRGLKVERKEKERFPTTMPKVRRKVVADIGKTVDDVVEAVISAMEEDTRNWVNGWLRNHVMVPPALERIAF